MALKYFRLLISSYQCYFTVIVYCFLIGKVAKFNYSPISQCSEDHSFMAEGDRFRRYEEEYLNSMKIVSRSLNQLNTASSSFGEQLFLYPNIIF